MPSSFDIRAAQDHATLTATEKREDKRNGRDAVTRPLTRQLSDFENLVQPDSCRKDTVGICTNLLNNTVSSTSYSYISTTVKIPRMPMPINLHLTPKPHMIENIYLVTSFSSLSNFHPSKQSSSARAIIDNQ